MGEYKTLLKGKYLVDGIIGEGLIGIVYKAKDIFENKHVAVKMSKKDGESMVIEIQVTTVVNKNSKSVKYFVHLRDHFILHDRQFLVYDLLHNDLQSHLRKSLSGMSMKTIRLVARQLLRALFELKNIGKKGGIIHGDLKPDNILFEGCVAKIADFGFAQITSLDTRNYPIQVMAYRAPEVVLRLHYDTSVDMWSLGCILLAMLTGKTFFKVKDEKHYMDELIAVIGMPPTHMIKTSPEWKEYFKLENESYVPKNKNTIPNSVSLKELLERKSQIFRRMWNPMYEKQFGHLVDLISLMLVWSPSRRISTDEALKHQFFRCSF